MQTPVDDLVYTYTANNPNRLKKVVDGAGANYVSYGFRNLTGSTGDYSYDSSGNLTADPYKGLTLTYNQLNRTDRITVTTATNRYVRYTYDSGGQLIRKQAYDNAVLQKTTDYIDGFVYENSTLAYFAIPEGRVVNVSGTLTPEFVISDQQGNARISFRDNGSGQAVVTQENSYYAFGLTFAASPVGTPAVPNKNLYNGGSEWQNDFSNLPDYYNTFFRNYDQALGRFVSLDPMAEAAESLTGYNYSGNNPVMFNDPLGDRLKDYVEPSLLWDGCEGCQARNAGGGGWSDAFTMMGVFGSSAAQQQQLLNDARNGDPAAIAAYTASLGAPTITDRGQINSIISGVNSGGSFSFKGDKLVYWAPKNSGNAILINPFTFTGSNDLGEVNIGLVKHTIDLGSGGNQGPGSEVLIGFYNSRYIASDFPFGEKLGIDGAFVGNVSGLGFDVQYTTSSGLQREFPVRFNMANFTIPMRGGIKDKYAASALFVLAYNLAVRESEMAIKTAIDLGTEKFINPATVKISFIGLVNANLNAAQLGSIFSGGGYALGNIPTTPAQWLFQ